ncbi:protein tyrosine phosphatase family protein [Curvibacter sp. CHRR-16]|uniref:protein tyrosine phosphatase family protein n=1 Tax=Curvibacter sp. CHRR-16 TaxID=2835872 RepID=UPI001BDB11F1|nr:protein tyrosine phosphatase family protein [Curvibacter sp. CHRR-16]MBT0571312.1 protein tyrosine phosphatase family protein [Curvibacter sp. CHRR-16]
MPISEVVKYVKINELLHTAGQPKADQLSDLSREGFKLVVNLGLHNDPRYSVPEEPTILESQGIEYLHIPVQFAAPTQEDFKKFLAAMKKATDRKTLVHCAHNKRVSVFMAIYLVLVENWSVESAHQWASEIWQADEVWSNYFCEMVAARG